MDLASSPVLVQIQGHSFWVHFLPPIARARIIAETVRQTYGGHMPARGVELMMPDGRSWRLRIVEGTLPPERHRIEGQWPLWLAWLAQKLDLAIAWHVEIKRALGRGSFERWEPIAEKRGQLAEHIGL